ncbi:hypothetical protein CMO91_05950 [Candidatus Woesearchaeota archaeon]|nr:hypothetical protein [Candidatus Woesearchaeota archaeon]
MKQLSIIVLLLAFAGCASGAATADQPIKIGGILMMSGKHATWGVNAERGASMAISDINAKGGVLGRPLTLVVEDNQGDNAKIAVTALHKLNSEGVRFVLGPNWSPSGLSVAPVACEEGIVMISPSLGVPGFNEECDYIFNLWPHDDKLSSIVGKKAASYGQVAVLGSQQVWEHTQAMAAKDGAEKAGSTVLLEIAQEGERDFKAESTKIKSFEPDAVVLTAYSNIDIAGKRIREMGVEVPFYSVILDQDLVSRAPEAFEGTVIATWFSPSEAHVARYRAAYFEEPDLGGADTGYDAIMLLAEAMEATRSTDPVKVKDYLNGLETYEGVSGFLTFDGEGAVTKPPVFKVVRDGKIVEE